MDDYFKQKSLKNESTRRLYERSILKFINYIDDNGIEVLDFRTQIFNELLNKFQKHLSDNYKYTDGTIRITTKIILNYLEYLEAEGKISNFRSVEIIDHDEVGPENIISDIEYNQLENYLISINDYLHLFLFQIAYYCGLKNKYLRTLKYNDFTTEYNGKFYYLNRIGGSALYKIYLPEKVKETFLKINIQKNNNIFLFFRNKKPYYERYLTRLFKKTCKNAGIKKYAPKDFRHTCILNYILDNNGKADDICLRFNWKDRDNSKRLYGSILKSKGIEI